MTSNNTTLRYEIDSALRSVNYPFLALGGIFIGFMGLLMVIAYHPNNLTVGLLPMIKFVLLFAGALDTILVGIIIGMVISKHYEPEVKRIINMPKDIATVQDALIALGSYVTTLGNNINSKEIAKIFHYITKQLARITPLENDIKTLKEDVKEMKKDFMPEFQLQRKEIIAQSLAREKTEKVANEKKEEVKILTEKLDQTTKKLLEALEELRRFKGE